MSSGGACSQCDCASVQRHQWLATKCMCGHSLAQHAPADPAQTTTTTAAAAAATTTSNNNNNHAITHTPPPPPPPSSANIAAAASPTVPALPPRPSTSAPPPPSTSALPPPPPVTTHTPPPPPPPPSSVVSPPASSPNSSPVNTPTPTPTPTPPPTAAAPPPNQAGALPPPPPPPATVVTAAAPAPASSATVTATTTAAAPTPTNTNSGTRTAPPPPPSRSLPPPTPTKADTPTASPPPPPPPASTVQTPTPPPVPTRQDSLAVPASSPSPSASTTTTTPTTPSSSGSYPPPPPTRVVSVGQRASVFGALTPPPPPPPPQNNNNGNNGTSTTPTTPTPVPVPTSTSSTAPPLPARQDSLALPGAAPSPSSASTSGSLPPPPIAHRPSIMKPPPPIPTRSQSNPSVQTSSPVVPVAAAHTPPPVPTPTATSSSSSSSSSTETVYYDQASHFQSTFATKLNHKFDLVAAQGESGMRVLKRVRSYFQKFCDLQERYAAELAKITSYERNKLIGMSKIDQMDSCWGAWMGFFESMDTLSQANLNLAVDVRERTVEQLERFHEIGTAMYEKNKAEQKAILATVEKNNIALSKDRETANESVKKLLKSRKKEGESDSTVTSSMEKNFQKAKETSLKHCEAYQSTLILANVALNKYNSHDAPQMFTQMQSLEEMRLHSLQATLKEFASCADSFSQSLEEVSQKLDTLAKNFKPEQDIDGFVQKTVAEYGPALPPIPHVYDVAVTPEEIRGMSVAEAPSSLFYSTLDGVMKYQKSIPHAAGLDVPLIVPVLLKHIADTGGFYSEGIFRISASSEELSMTRKQLERGDYNLSTSDLSPHVSAALLKSWLRDLSNPLLPYASYEKCIALGAVENFNEKTNPAHVEMIKNIIKELPPINQKTIAILFTFLKMLLAPECVEVTRMNVHNLSLVFSPGLLRSESTDPHKMLRDTKYASLAVQRLLEYFPNNFPAESVLLAQQILKDVKPLDLRQ